GPGGQRDRGAREPSIGALNLVPPKMNHPSRSRLLTLATIAILPSFLKRPLYRLFYGYKIGKRVRIGLSIIDAGDCTIADDVSIGHFNVVTRVQKLTIKDHVRIGHLNIIRGGD